MTYAENLKEAAEATPPTSNGGKTYPQFNEDGTPLLGDDGLQVWGPEKSKFKKAKKAKAVEYEKNEDGSDKLDEAGNKIPVKKAKKVKEIEYQKDENGEFILDEAGNKIPVKKTRQPKLDADGNPIPRLSNVFLDSQVINHTEKGKTTKYREGSKRGKHFESIYDGMTVGEYYKVNGGKKSCHRYLVHQVNVMGTITIS